MLFDILQGLALTGETTTSTINWGNIITADSFQPMLDGISTVLPVVIPVGLTITGLFVVWRVVKKMVKG